MAETAIHSSFYLESDRIFGQRMNILLVSVFEIWHSTQTQHICKHHAIHSSHYYLIIYLEEEYVNEQQISLSLLLFNVQRIVIITSLHTINVQIYVIYVWMMQNGNAFYPSSTLGIQTFIK